MNSVIFQGDSYLVTLIKFADDFFIRDTGIAVTDLEQFDFYII